MKENNELKELEKVLLYLAENLRIHNKLNNLELFARSALDRFNVAIENKKQSLNSDNEDKLKFFQSVNLTPKEESLITEFVDSLDITERALRKKFFNSLDLTVEAESLDNGPLKDELSSEAPNFPMLEAALKEMAAKINLLCFADYVFSEKAGEILFQFPIENLKAFAREITIKGDDAFAGEAYLKHAPEIEALMKLHQDYLSILAQEKENKRIAINQLFKNAISVDDQIMELANAWDNLNETDRSIKINEVTLRFKQMAQSEEARVNIALSGEIPGLPSLGNINQASSVVTGDSNFFKHRVTIDFTPSGEMYLHRLLNSLHLMECDPPDTKEELIAMAANLKLLDFARYLCITKGQGDLFFKLPPEKLKDFARKVMIDGTHDFSTETQLFHRGSMEELADLYSKDYKDHKDYLAQAGNYRAEAPKDPPKKTF